jgi:hypothetical protein
MQGNRDTPEFVILEGILDGRVLNEDTLQAAVNELNQTHGGTFRLEVTGGRFNIMPGNSLVSGERFDPAVQNDFLDRLQAIADAAQPGSIETNLRCKMVFEQDVAETLFVVRGMQLEAVTRRRPRTQQDVVPDSLLGRSDRPTMRRRELTWLIPGLLLLTALLAWQSGLIDRLLAARGEPLSVQTGPFEDMVSVTTEQSWGNYYITLHRGPGYPTTTAALTARRDASASLTTRAACELVGNGGELFVQIAQADGAVICETLTNLRSLLTDADGKVNVRLPGSMAAHHVVLSLSSGERR